MSNPAAVVDEHDTISKTSLGFWIYLMTDCMMFAALFATFIVLRGGMHGGPDSSELFSMPFVLTETLILLASSYTCGLAVLALRKQNKKQLLGWLGATFVLGLAFLTMELIEFGELMAEGHGWWSNAFMSAFFTLVGTHGAHILVGLMWIGFMIWMIVKRGLGGSTPRRLALLSMFWHFLDVIWIFIFTIVYLIGVL